MRESYSIVFNAPDAIVQSILTRYPGSKHRQAGDLHTIRLATQPPEELIKELVQSGCDPSVRVERHYTEDDLRSAKLLALFVRRVPRGLVAPPHTEFDWTTGCPECGTGARQISPARLAASELPPKPAVFEAGSGQVFVHEDFVAQLSDAGGHLRQAESRRNFEKLPWWQLITDQTLPKLDPASRGIVADIKMQCGACRRDGFFGLVEEPLDAVFECDAPVHGIAGTWECFGRSIRTPQTPRQVPRVAQPRIVLTTELAGVVHGINDPRISLIPIKVL